MDKPILFYLLKNVQEIIETWLTQVKLGSIIKVKINIVYFTDIIGTKKLENCIFILLKLMYFT